MSLMERINLWLNRYLFWILAGGFLLALFLRFINLGAAALSDREAESALWALSIARGQEPLLTGSSGYVGLTSMLFFLFGGSDFFARFWPALFGSALVLTPGFFRKYLDDFSVVLAALIFALEPGLVAVSRTADGLSIALFSFVAAVGFLMHKKMVPAGFFAGLAFVSSPAFWPLILVIGMAGFFAFFTGRDPVEKEAVQFCLLKKDWLLFTVCAGVSILISSTFFLQFPAGISGVASGLTQYLDSWQQADGLQFGSLLLVLFVTQFPVLILGLWGLIAGLREKSSLMRFLGLWWIMGLIAWSLNPSVTEQHITLINLPLFVLTALQIRRVVQNFNCPSKIVVLVEIVVTISLLIFSSINLLNLTNVLMDDPAAERNRLLGTLLPLLLWVIFTVLLAWGWDAPSTKSGLLISFGLLGLALLLGSGWKAAGLGSRPDNEFLAGKEYVIGEARLMTSISHLSLWNIGVANRIDVKISGLNKPSLVWSLRDFEKLSQDSTFQEKSDASIILANPESMVKSDSVYRGTSLLWSVRPEYTSFTWKDWIKWFFIRSVPQTKNNLVVWVRNDLFKDFQSIQ